MSEPVRVAVLTGAWLVGWWLCGRVRVLPATGARGRPPTDRPGDGGSDTVARPRVSIVVPARDEAETLPTLLAGLAVQRTAPSEIVVVDDGSRDATAAVAAAHGARVLTAPALPDGWTGKAWALWQGVQETREGLVVLLDADVEPGPDLVEHLTTAHAASGGLLSVQPYHRMRRWWERASAFFNLVAVMGVGIGSPSWPRRRAIVAAFGPVLVCPRALFLAHGDRTAVRSAVVEDVALAQSIGGAGEPVSTYAGGDLVAFRMYDRPARLLEGWAKNFASGARAVPFVRLLLVIGWVAACLVSGAWVLGGSVAALVLYVAFAAQCFVQLRQLGVFGVVTALLYPVLAALFVLVFLASLALLARGEVSWKGRRIRLRSG